MLGVIALIGVFVGFCIGIIIADLAFRKITKYGINPKE